jgi:hypothetical protein
VDVSSIELHFDGGELDQMSVEADVGGWQLQGSGVPKRAEEQIHKAADRLLNLVTRELRREIREGLKD